MTTAESVEYVVIGYAGDQFCSHIAPALLDLSARGRLRVLDVVLVGKDRLGDVVVYRHDHRDHPSGSSLGAVDTVLGSRTCRLVTDIDAIYAAEELPPASTAALIAWQRLPRGTPPPTEIADGGAAPAGPIPHDITRVALADLVTARASDDPAVPVAAGACRPRSRPSRHGTRRGCEARSRRGP